jgi:hypothetical protein
MAVDEAEAEQVLAATVSAAAAELGEELDAVFALGSLAHGGFARWSATLTSPSS